MAVWLIAVPLASPQVKELRPVYKFGDVPLKEERIRLDNFAVQLRREPSDTRACIVVCAKRTGEAQKRADRAKTYLINNRGIKEASLSFANCVRPKLEFELYIVPAGTKAPAPCK